jgi:hypothetical protein
VKAFWHSEHLANTDWRHSAGSHGSAQDMEDLWSYDPNEDN